MIVGGGLSGLVTGIELARSGVPCTIVEKKAYPFHRVCGEYVSNEVTPFLKRSELFPEEFSPPEIRRLLLSSVSGKHRTIPLDLGGFGISRFSFDHFLYLKACALGVGFFTSVEATGVQFRADKFQVQTTQGNLEADVVIGAFGKRSKLDGAMNRPFIKRRSPYIGIKYHVRAKHPAEVVALHNFEGGYCGVSNVENGITNVCYLVRRELLREAGSIPALEQKILARNPFLAEIFHNADFIFKKPEVINEISFETKGPVADHVLFAGDAAGMIAPLCGNGMAMAIHAGKVLAVLVSAFCQQRLTRASLEVEFARAWHGRFARRLWYGRQVQRMFGHPAASAFVVDVLLRSSPLASALVRRTHGGVF